MIVETEYRICTRGCIRCGRAYGIGRWKLNNHIPPFCKTEAEIKEWKHFVEIELELERAKIEPTRLKKYEEKM